MKNLTVHAGILAAFLFAPAATCVLAQSTNAATGGASGTDSTVNLGATILTYQAEEEIGADIAREIADSTNCNSLRYIYITTELQNIGGGLIQYESALNQLRLLAANYESSIKSAKEWLKTRNETQYPSVFRTSAFLPIATNVANLLSSVVGLAGTTTTLNGVPVTANEMGIIPVVAERLRKSRVQIHSSFVDLFVDTSYVTNRGLFYQLSRDAMYRAEGQAITNALLQPPYTNLFSLPFPAQTNFLALSALNGQFDNLLASSLNTNTMSSFLTADFYENNVKGHTDNALLYLQVLFAGGEDRTKSNPLLNVAFDGPRINYAGGAVVAYILIGSDGSTLLSGVARDLIPYEKIPNKIGDWPYLKKIKGNLRSRP